MKTSIILIFCLFVVGCLQAEEKEVITTVSRVLLYIDGAQVTRAKTFDLQKGRTTLKFTNLSQYIDPKSISVKSAGNLTVLSVNHRLNYLPAKTSPEKYGELEKRRLELENQIKVERVYVEILNDQVAFLNANKQLGGANTGINSATLREVTAFYGEKITEAKLKQNERNNKINDLSDQLKIIYNQYKSLSDEKVTITSEVYVEVDAKAQTEAKFELNYVVGNAGWNPAYDFRVATVSQPVLLVYKANVRQNTGEEWNNVKLILSSGNPKVSGILQELKPYFLNYNITPPSYNIINNQVIGYVKDQNGKPLPGATIQVKGTTIGTVSDANGFYSIYVPGSGVILVYSFIGCRTQEQYAYKLQINVVLQDDVALEDAVATDAQFSALPGISSLNTKRARNISPAPISASSQLKRTQSEFPLEIVTLQNQTTVEFEIETPYTIPSTGQNFTIDVLNYSIDADYQYVSIPKITQQAYLNARVTGWEKYNLLEGEASVFFEDTYNGKTLLDLRNMPDTMTVSLGIDKGVSVKRELQRKFTTRQFLGSKKEESKSWLITVRNNKQQPVRLVLYDQVPVSTTEEIEVAVLQLSGGKLDKETGKVTWEVMLNPSEKDEFLVNYSVKYPKNQSLIIE